MSHLQVKNIPESLHDRIRQRATEEGCTLSDFVLRSVESELSRGDWLRQLRERPITDLGVRASKLVEEDRRDRAI